MRSVRSGEPIGRRPPGLCQRDVHVGRRVARTGVRATQPVAGRPRLRVGGAQGGSAAVGVQVQCDGALWYVAPPQRSVMVECSRPCVANMLRHDAW